MSDGDGHIGIGEMCARFDVTPRTLRFYEQKGLLQPRREGLKRLFGARERARLTLILRGRRFGLSLDEISDLLALYDAGGQRAQLQPTLKAARRQLTALVAQRADLDETIDDLRAQIATIEAMLDNAP